MNIPFTSLKRFAACCCLLLAAQVYGQVPADGLTLRFYLSRTEVDTIYMDNARTLSRLNQLLADSSLVAHIDSVHIFSYASPDGRQDSNIRLSLQRSLAVKDYLSTRYPYLDARRIRPRPQGEDWQGMRRLIAAADSLPLRGEVLRIIDSTPDDERCKALLKHIGGGRPYRYIARHILPLLRNASVCTVYLRTPLPALSGEDAQGAGMEHIIGQADALHHGDYDDREDNNGGNLPFQSSTHQVRRPLFAIKTNLLFDLAMAPNIEVEIPLGKDNRWSVNAEWMFPWWLFEGDKYCFQILSGGVEGRYWLGNRSKHRALTGHFVGFYAGAGKYDLQWDRDGYQGEFYIASGISYGYALPIARNLSLEFSIGIGLMRTSYEHYHTLDNYQTLLWQENGRYTWLGPTKAKISFVWLLGRKAKVQQKGGAR